MFDSMSVDEMVARSIKAMREGTKKATRSPQAARAFLRSIGLDENGHMGDPARLKRKSRRLRKAKK